MRIGLVTGEYPPMEGGVGAFTRELARELLNLGHGIYVFTRKAAAGALDEGIMVTGAIGELWNRQANAQTIKWAADNYLDVVNVQFQTAAYDLRPAIHTLPKQMQPRPTVVTFHDLRVPYLFPKAGPLRTWIVRKLAKDAAGVIATDRADEYRLSDWGVTPCRWIPIGSNVAPSLPADYERAAWRAKLGAEKREILISYFGFLNASKGGLTLVEALHHLTEKGIPARLVMIGGRAGASDPTNYAYGKQIDARITELGLGDRVTFTGFVPDAEVSAYFKASDVTALPYTDGVSLRRGTLMAALAHGMPVITTEPAVPLPELEGAVALVPPQDPAALAGMILAVFEDPARRKRMSRAALAAHESFGWASIAQQTAAFFAEIVR